MDEIRQIFNTLKTPLSLLTPNEKIENNTLQALTILSQELDTQILTTFDHEQIWGQINLINIELKKSSEIPPISGPLFHESEQEDQLVEDTFEQSEETRPIEEVDFFDEEEMEAFAEEDEFEVPLESDESSEPEKEVDYKEFYGHEESAEEEQEQLFSFHGDQELDNIETELVSVKPWQLTGETTAKSRPVNSLLDEDLEFEVARLPPPVTQTPQFTDQIEEIIKQRILDMNFDDVRLKISQENKKLNSDPADFMDYEKSKKSLAELYEEDYKKKVLNLPIQTEQEKAKKEATVLFKKLCYNLDLLSSLHPVAKPVEQSLEIKSSETPALALEEELPFGVNRGFLVSTTEDFNPKEVEFKAEEEETSTDRDRKRKKHRTLIKHRKREKIMKMIAKIANDPKGEKFEYRRILKEQKARKELIERKKEPETKFTRSSEFFKNIEKLQTEPRRAPDKKPSKKYKL